MKKTTMMITAITIFALFAGSALAQNFALSSQDIKGRLSPAQVLSGYGCNGQNMSPALTWSDAPAETKSFAVTLYDPDARAGQGWWHWFIFNIPAGVHELPADAGNPQKNLAPEGSVQSKTDFGKPGFGGACPPKREIPHRYIFTVYALDVEKLDLDENDAPRKVVSALEKHAIAKASLTSHYGR